MGRLPLVLLFPVLEQGNDRFHVGANLLFGPSFGGHVFDAEIDELLLAFVLERAVVVAPFAVVLVERAVQLAAEARIVQRHPAALADQCSGSAQQGVDGDIKKTREQFQRFDVRRRLARLPAGHRLPGHVELFG